MTPRVAEVGGAEAISTNQQRRILDSERSVDLGLRRFSSPPERFTVRAHWILIFPFIRLPSQVLKCSSVAGLLSVRMMPLRPSKTALRAIHLQRQLASGRRPFSTSFVASAASPHRSSPQKRAQSTVTATS